MFFSQKETEAVVERSASSPSKVLDADSRMTLVLGLTTDILFTGLIAIEAEKPFVEVNSETDDRKNKFKNSFIGGIIINEI